MLQAIMWYKFATMAGSPEALNSMARLYVGGETHVEGDGNLDNSGVACFLGFGDDCWFRWNYPQGEWIRPDIREEICADIKEEYPSQEFEEGFEEDWGILSDFSPYEVRDTGTRGDCSCGVAGCRRSYHQYEVWHKGRWREAGEGEEFGRFVGPEKLLWKGAYHVIETGPERRLGDVPGFAGLWPQSAECRIPAHARVEMLQPTTDCDGRLPNHRLIANAEAKYAGEKRDKRSSSLPDEWDPEMWYGE